jgi:hypothetical protein
MSTELEDRLRWEMREVTAGARVPPGLARRARRNRRRRIMTRATAAAGTAAAVAVALVAAGTTGASRDVGSHTTAYIVKHAESALDTAVAANDIMYVRSADGSERRWFYLGPQGSSNRWEIIPSPGQPSMDMGVAATPASRTITWVFYRAKTWWRIEQAATPAPQPRAHNSCSSQIPLSLDVLDVYESPAVLVANIREALACGQLTNEGTQYVDGVAAIKLVIKLVSVHTFHVPKLPGTITVTATTTVWVNPASYLPVRWAQDSKITGRKGTSAPAVDEQDVQWLPPTRANLAQLTVPIPPGFTHGSTPP